MSADSPASGLPQEAVDAAAEAVAEVLAQHGRSSAHDEAAVAALTAALPFLHEQWLLDHDCYGYLTETADLLAAERAKVAGLREAVDKVRALCQSIADLPASQQWIRPLTLVRLIAVDAALLPAVQADGRGTTTPNPATTCADCGTTRTICDAGLNTYDTRCCEQCGHGVT